MKAGEILHGFELQYSRELPEIKATLHRFTYVKNGADTIWLEREDDNKSFAIAFRTVPQDDTGVFHILEHSVLNGSEKYPLREPFVELLKSSLATFLNAMTYPDKTVYPVASRNDKDFMNLIDVYMDAVLHPLSLRDPHAFRQEGWHYELEDPEGELTVNGVVYNEMKGAYTSPEGLIRDELDRQLFPDTCYGKDSGGDPDHIPELTYESYLAHHRRFYHPSNAYIFLDGSIRLDEVFARLDSFLRDYDRIDPDSEIALQAPVAPPEKTVYYPVDPGEETEGKAMLGMGWVYGMFDDTLKNLAVSVLTDVLAGSNDAPLTRALLEAGLCEDVSLESSDITKQMYVHLIVKNCDPAKKEEIRALIDKTLREQAAQGLDRKRLSSVLSRMEFLSREKDFGGMSKGLIYGIGIMGIWLYGGDPSKTLCTDELFAALREMAENGGFEELLREVFLEGRHRAEVIMLPSLTMAEEKRAAERERLAEIRAGWTEEQVRRTIDEFRALRERQNTPDTPEQQAKLPRLALTDIPVSRTPIGGKVTDLDGTVVLHQDEDTSGISYLNLYFSLADMTAEELTRASIFAVLMGSVATENYDVTALRSEINERTGRLSIHPRVTNGLHRTSNFVVLQLSVLENRKREAAEIIDEILNRTVFTDEAYILNLIRQDRMDTEQHVMMHGDGYAARHALAALSAGTARSEAIQGLAVLRQLQKEEKEFGPDTLAWMTEMRKRIFIRERMTMSLTGPMDREWLRTVRDSIPSGTMGAPAEIRPIDRRADGFVIPSEIGYAARAAVLVPENRGAAMVASQILTLDYMWNMIRVQGGAYGTNFRITEYGGMTMTSYRDPDAAKSLEVFLGAADALRTFCRDGGDLTQYIISTIGMNDNIRTPRTVAPAAEWMYFTGTTEEDRSREWSQMLHTTKEQLLALADAIEKACGESNICVIGGQKTLDECGDRLAAVETVRL